MTKQKSTKRALLLSALSLLMCVSMLIGSTFAWFTDSVTSGNNKIVAGTLDIALYEVEPDPAALFFGGDPVKVIGEITNSSDPLFGEDIRWEPGYAAVSNLMLENKGNLALKWQAIVRPVADIGELADVIDVYVARQLLYTEHSSFEEQKDTLTKVGTLRDVMNGKAILSGAMEEKGDPEWFSIVLKMQETAGNEYQGKSAGAFDITILATQYTSESDSFNNQYDAGAELPVVTSVDSQAELNAAISAGADTVYLAEGTYKLPGTTNKEVTISGTKDTVIDLSNGTSQMHNMSFVFDGVTIKGATQNYKGIIHSKSVAYKNCTLTGLQFLYAETVTFENCDFDSNGEEHSIWTYGSKNVSFVDCDFTYGDRAVNVYLDNGTGSVNVSFEGCTFTTTNAASKGAVEINSSAFPLGANVSFVDCTAPAYGTMVGISGWDSANGANATVTVDGVASTPAQWAK